MPKHGFKEQRGITLAKNMERAGVVDILEFCQLSAHAPYFDLRAYLLIPMLSVLEGAPPPAPVMEQVTQPNLSDTKSPQILVEGGLVIQSWPIGGIPPLTKPPWFTVSSTGTATECLVGLIQGMLENI